MNQPGSSPGYSIDFSIKKSLATTYSPTKGSTIGAGGLNFRVRNGNGWDPSAMSHQAYKIIISKKLLASNASASDEVAHAIYRRIDVIRCGMHGKVAAQRCEQRLFSSTRGTRCPVAVRKSGSALVPKADVFVL